MPDAMRREMRAPRAVQRPRGPCKNHRAFFIFARRYSSAFNALCFHYTLACVALAIPCTAVRFVANNDYMNAIINWFRLSVTCLFAERNICNANIFRVSTIPPLACPFMFACLLFSRTCFAFF